jgi:hypothetical protein
VLIRPIAFALLCAFLAPPTRAGEAKANCFVIKVVDAETGRGVPLVELRTVHAARYWTDSAGIVAFQEPGLLGEEVFFSVKSHGYEEPAADGFGIRGVRFKAEAGKTATVKLKRTNIAERLYRITGEGIYRDSVLAGLPVPLKNPVLNGKVLGQDTVFTTEYRGKLFWLWGDTNRPSYPLGNFSTSCATSQLPGQGGLDPDVGIDLTYFVDKTGFCKKMCPLPEPGVVWMSSLIALPDEKGNERLLGRWSRLTGLTELKERGFASYQDEKEQFEKLTTFAADQHVIPDGQAYRDGGPRPDRAYVYFVTPYPSVRVKANVEAFKQPEQFEAFTCLKAGTRAKGKDSELDRDANGALVWSWKANTAAVGDKPWEELVKAGKVKADEAWNWVVDAQTGKHIENHNSTVGYSEYRGRYFMIILQSHGDPSYLGEVWYAEAEKLEGPWRKAVKIVTHTKYTFYNVLHHPEFNQKRGQLIYFEGTYCNTFSGNPEQTPRYDYNQMMYRLDLADTRLRVLEGK